MEFSYITKTVAKVMVPVILLSTFLSSAASAGMIETETVIAQSQMNMDKQQLLSLVQSDDVKQQLQSMGISSEDAEQRINALTAEELSALNQQLADAPAGGNAVIGALLVIFVLFVITDMACATDIFSFVKCVNK
ncbi:PA2779 family protein [Halioxenophilus sp. WMMB6]|uniref:PA2779 family protein n=1 Tax=Halioxenophilus sp. WMMB6 TaxID=3073815 RepID=UPI00295F47D5|nr:PA2779 family protein [Halioxenophilus sp. WMMB6]